MAKHSSGIPPVDVDLPQKVSSLPQCERYPEHPSRVDVIESHGSWVLKTPTHALQGHVRVQVSVRP